VSVSPVDNHSCIRQQYAFDALLYRPRKCIRRSSTIVTTSSEPSLSCGSNAGMLQRNHPRLHWMNTQHAMHPCIQTYPSCCRCSSLNLPVTTATAERSFNSTHKRLKTYLRSSTRDGRLTSLALIHVHAQTTPLEPVEVVDKFALTGPHNLNFLS